MLPSRDPVPSLEGGVQNIVKEGGSWGGGGPSTWVQYEPQCGDFDHYRKSRSDSKEEENHVVVTRGKELLVMCMEPVGLSVDHCGRDWA